MNARLDRLSAQLDALPASGDPARETVLKLLKAQGTALTTLVAIAQMGVGGDTMEETLRTSEEMIGSAAEMLGEDHEGVVLARKILAIATAALRGLPEPTDEQLSAAPGAVPRAAATRKGGCLAMLLVLAAGVGGVLAQAACR